jgi:hypothetical protein
MNYQNENPRGLSGLLTSRLLMIVAIVILIIMLLRQCKATSAAEAEALREHNNYLAQLDSVRLISKSRDNAVYEKSAFERKVSELTQEEKDLIKKLELKSNGKGTTPKTVIETVTEYVDTFRNIASRVIEDTSGGTSLTFKYEPTLPGKNKFSLTGKTPYTIGLTRNPADTAEVWAKLNPGNTEVTISQNIDLVTGIYRDPKSKRLMTRVSTSYPNMTFSDIHSFDITDNPDTREIMKKSRKEWGLGVTIGYGIAGSSTGIKTGIMMGVGLHYTPRWLQFGK